MEAIRYVELEQLIACGDLDCLKACCAAGKLRVVATALRGLDARGLALLEKMLCGCAIQGGPGVTGNACFDAAMLWARDNRSTVNGIQTILIAASGTGIPFLDQTITVMMGVMEGIEDAATAVTRDGVLDEGAMAETLRTLCAGVATMRDWHQKAVSALPAGLSNLVDLIGGLVTGAAGFITCCGSTPAAGSPNPPAQPGGCANPPPIEGTPIVRA